jgi:hypothetical protein
MTPNKVEEFNFDTPSVFEPLPIIQNDLDDSITKGKIEEMAAQELGYYEDPIEAYVTSKMLELKAKAMIELSKDNAVSFVKEKGNQQWQGVSITYIKPKIKNFQIKSIEERIAALDPQLFEKETMVDEITQEYEKDIMGLMEIENELFQIERDRDAKIAEIQKEYAESIAFATRLVDEFKENLIKEGKADVEMSAAGVMVKFPN